MHMILVPLHAFLLKIISDLFRLSIFPNVQHKSKHIYKCLPEKSKQSAAYRANVL